MSSPLFSLRDVTLPGSHAPRLNSVTLTIPVGTTAVVGLSGAGKSSLLNVLAGFETDFTGRLESFRSSEHALGGRGWTERSERSPGVSNYRPPTPATLRPNRLPLFWVPQNGGLWPHLSVEQQLNVVSGEAGQDRKSLKESGRISERTDEFLRSFDLDHRRKALPAELSQGERSRLAVARALATQAEVLLLDEPLSHVDPVRKPGYWKIVRQFVAKENISMVFTSHEPETVLRQAEHVICLHAGSVAFNGTVRTLYEDPPNAEIGEFLGPLNWFTLEEAATLLADQTGVGNIAMRPERMQILRSINSAIEFVSQSFAGLYAESIVRHSTSGAVTTVRHQASHPVLNQGERVTFRVLPSSGAKS